MKMSSWLLNLLKGEKAEDIEEIDVKEATAQVQAQVQAQALSDKAMLKKDEELEDQMPSVLIKEEKTVELERFVVFEAGDIWLGIGIGEITEIVTNFTITPVPQIPDYIEGVMNLRGDMIPIVNLSSRLDLLKKPKTSKTKIVILKEPHVKVGFVVDEMREIIKVEAELIISMPQFISEIKMPHHFLKGVTLYKEELLFILDVEEILSKDTDKSMYTNIGDGS